MSYVMSKRLYWNLINGDKHEQRAPMTHNEIINYLNYQFGIRGKITELHVGQ